eukprot:360699-Chlamydomonas_euryale.AAC.3
MPALLVEGLQLFALRGGLRERHPCMGSQAPGALGKYPYKGKGQGKDNCLVHASLALTVNNKALLPLMHGRCRSSRSHGSFETRLLLGRLGVCRQVGRSGQVFPQRTQHRVSSCQSPDLAAKALTLCTPHTPWARCQWPANRWPGTALGDRPGATPTRRLHAPARRCPFRNSGRGCEQATATWWSRVGRVVGRLGGVPRGLQQADCVRSSSFVTWSDQAQRNACACNAEMRGTDARKRRGCRSVHARAGRREAK